MTLAEATTHEFYVRGMYCKACVVLTELEIAEVSGVSSVKADLQTQKVAVDGVFPGKSPAEISDELSKAIAPFGYSLSTEPEKKGILWTDFAIALPAALGFIALYLLLQKAGIVKLVKADTMSYATAFLIGVVASLSTCMAVVGGMVLSISANFAKSGQGVRPQVLFHVGRFVSFFALGGVIGAAGTLFQLSNTGMFALTFAVGVVMLLLGVKLLDVLPSSGGVSFFTLPRWISSRFLNWSRTSQTVSPLLMGSITFVLPCAFTQAMQFYTLSAGGFWAGAFTMTMFAIGTFPVLALLSFGALGFRGRRTSSVFFKTAGLTVVAFAVFNIVNSFAIAGWIPPVFNL